MTLDLKAKAEAEKNLAEFFHSLQFGYGIISSDIDYLQGLIEEVQDATREEEGFNCYEHCQKERERTIRECLDLVPDWSTTLKIRERILALLTTPEKNSAQEELDSLMNQRIDNIRMTENIIPKKKEG